MAYGELYIEHERTDFNPINGQFLKGHKIVHNKGKKPKEWIDGRKYKRWRRLAIQNLNHKWETGNIPCNRRSIIAITGDGKWSVFKCARLAAEKIGCNERNIRRCCEFNADRTPNQKTGNINTDNRYYGIRWYWESDDVWTTKLQ